MRIITATTRTQGQRASDFAHAIEGEVVTLADICDSDALTGPDGPCGCSRAFAGLNSHKATTTAIVADIDGYGPGELLEAVRSSLQQSGRGAHADIVAPAEAATLAALAACHPAGTVLERRGDEIRPRGQR